MSATSEALLESIQELEKQIALVKAANGETSQLENQLSELKKKHVNALSVLSESRQILRG